MGEQLSFDAEPADAPEMFAADGRRRCPHCRRPLTAFAGRFYCLAIGCPGGAS